MGGLDFRKEDIYYDKEKHTNLVLSWRKISQVSIYLDTDMEKRLLEIINFCPTTKDQYEEKISKIDSLKQEVLASLVEIRSEYKKLYYRVKAGKKLSDWETAQLEKIRIFKDSFASYVRFLDGALHIEHKALNNLVRKNTRYNNVDMKTSIILDDDSKFIYDMMVDHENFYETDNHIYLQALSYYIKNVDFSKLDEDGRNICIEYVDEITNRLKDNSDASLYLENIEDVNLLKQVVCQRGRSLSKEDKMDKDFLNMIGKKISLLEERYTGHVDLIETDGDVEICEAFYRAINDEKNINVISSFLNERPDLIYMESPSNKTQYYLADIISTYGNLLLNSKENHMDFKYYHLLVNTYIDTINTLDNQDMKVYVLKKLQRIIRNVNNSDFSMRRKEACFFEIEECINKINGKNEKKLDSLLEFHSNQEISHKANNECIFSIDGDDTKNFEQAYSYREKNGNKYIGFYIPDTTELYGTEIPTINELLVSNNEDNSILNSKIRRRLSLKQGDSHDVIGYHFVIDSDYEVKKLDIKKEKVNVSNNFTFDEIETIIKEDNYYSDTLCKMMNTLEMIDGIDGIVKKEKTGKYLTEKLSLFFQQELGKYCDNMDIPYISRFVYKKKQAEMGLVRMIDETLNSRNLTIEQIIKSVEDAYMKGIYTTNREENVDSIASRRAKVTAPFRQLSSFINQIVIYHYFTNGDNISYREDLRNRRDLHNIADYMNQKLIENEMEESYKEEQELKAKIKKNNKQIRYRMRKASEN